MKSRATFALTATVGAILLLSAAAGGIGVFLGMREFGLCSQCGGVAQITLGQASFNSTTKTLDFGLNNIYASNTTVSSVDVGQTPCNGTFPVVLAHSITSFSCTVTNSEAHFVRGQNVTFVVYLGNAQLDTDTIISD